MLTASAAGHLSLQWDRVLFMSGPGVSYGIFVSLHLSARRPWTFMLEIATGIFNADASLTCKVQHVVVEADADLGNWQSSEPDPERGAEAA